MGMIWLSSSPRTTGENMGELGIYGEHATADEPTCHIPMIIKWPGAKRTLSPGAFMTMWIFSPPCRSFLERKLRAIMITMGVSYAGTLLEGEDCARESVVLTQCCHVCQRSAGFKGLPLCAHNTRRLSSASPGDAVQPEGRSPPAAQFGGGSIRNSVPRAPESCWTGQMR